MINGLALVDKSVAKTLLPMLHNVVGLCTERKLELLHYVDSASLDAQLDTINILDFAIIDLTLPDSLMLVKKIREVFAYTEILLISNTKLSPVQYVTPSIKPGALLLHPVSEQWKAVLQEFISYLTKLDNAIPEEEVLKIKSREGSMRVLIDNILYLEARNKKVTIRMKQEEIEISDTLDGLMMKLPYYFAKSHRSFIVNLKKIKKIMLSENVIVLDTDETVPISRTYREAFKL